METGASEVRRQSGTAPCEFESSSREVVVDHTVKELCDAIVPDACFPGTRIMRGFTPIHSGYRETGVRDNDYESPVRGQDATDLDDRSLVVLNVHQRHDAVIGFGEI